MSGGVWILFCRHQQIKSSKCYLLTRDYDEYERADEFWNSKRFQKIQTNHREEMAKVAMANDRQILKKSSIKVRKPTVLGPLLHALFRSILF